MAAMITKLQDSKAAHAKQIKLDARSLEHVKLSTAKAKSVADVLAKAKQLLGDSQHHMSLIQKAIPEAQRNVEKARAAAKEANVDLEEELSKHHLSLEAISASKDEEQAAGHAIMLNNIREKRQNAQNGIDQVHAERQRLSHSVRQAVQLMDRVVAEQETEPKSTLSTLKVDAARAHAADMLQQQSSMQQGLDQVQAEYQTARDQLRDTELQTVLFDASVGGSLTEATTQLLQAKLKLAANADDAFAQAVQYGHQLHQAKYSAQIQIEASAPLLKRAIRMLTKLKHEDASFKPDADEP
jgi:hypothetical protein